MKSRFLFIMMALFTAATSFAAINAQKYYMTLANATVAQGGTVEVALSMNNEKAITLWQTELVLPEGVSLVEVKSAGTRYAAEPAISVEGSTIVCDCGTAMTGTEGVVATLVLKVAANAAEGEVKISVQNDNFLDETGKNWKKTDAHEATLTITKAEEQGVKGDVNGDNVVSVADILAIATIIADGTNDAAADVNGDEVVSVADILAVASIIAGN